MSSTCENPKILRGLPLGLRATFEECDPRFVPLVRETIQNGRWPLLMHGSVGSGKTCAAALVHASWPTTPVRWVTALEFIRWIQTARREGDVLLPGAMYETTEVSLWSWVVDQPSMLILDDLGIRVPTESQQEIVYELIDRRRDKPMLITSNHDLTTLGNLYDQRVASRLSAGTSLHFDLDDRRPSGLRYRLGRVAS